MKLDSVIAKLLVTAVVAISAAPASAAANAQTSATEEGSKAAERLVCKRIEMTGSRTRTRKVCLTSEQWKKIDSNDL